MFLMNSNGWDIYFFFFSLKDLPNVHMWKVCLQFFYGKRSGNECISVAVFAVVAQTLAFLTQTPTVRFAVVR